VKKFLLVVVILAAAFTGYRLFQNRFAEEAYLTFETAMNKAVGNNGQWEAKSHDFSLASRTLNVHGVKITVKPEATGLPNPLILTVNEVAVKNGLRKAALDNLLGLSDWKGQTETNIADQLTLSDIKTQSQVGEGTVDFSINSADLSGVKLLAAPQDSPDGPLGFIKSFTFQKGGFSKLSFILQGPGQKYKFLTAIDTFSLTEPHLGQRMDSADDPLFLLQLISSFAYQEIKITNYELSGDITDGGFVLQIGQILEKQANGRGKIGHYSLENIAVGVNSAFGEESNIVDLSCDKIALENFDTSQLMDKMYPKFRQLYMTVLTGDTDSAIQIGEEIYDIYHSAASIFSIPFDLDALTVSNFKVSYNDSLAFGIKKADIKGPFKANRIPENSTTDVNIFVNLPKEDRPSPHQILSKAYTFGRELGQFDFDISFSSKVNYDPKTTVFKTGPATLDIKDLFSVDFFLQLEKLTQEMVTAMAEVSLREPAGLFGIPGVTGLTLRKLTLDFKDASLVNKFLNFSAKQSDSTTEEILEKAKYSFERGVNDDMNSLDQRNELITAVKKFLDKPGQISFALDPAVDLSAESVMPIVMSGDSSILLNLLNIFVGFNGEAPLNLHWAHVAAPTFDSEDLNNNPQEDDEEFFEGTFEEDAIDDEDE
jgi:hypothetical protein